MKESWKERTRKKKESRIRAQEEFAIRMSLAAVRRHAAATDDGQRRKDVGHTNTHKKEFFATSTDGRQRHLAAIKRAAATAPTRASTPASGTPSRPPGAAAARPLCGRRSLRLRVQQIVNHNHQLVRVLKQLVQLAPVQRHERRRHRRRLGAARPIAPPPQTRVSTCGHSGPTLPRIPW